MEHQPSPAGGSRSGDNRAGGSRPLRKWLPEDGIVPWPVSSVATFSLDVLEAALLHRDPPAERSRLTTRRFTAGWAKQWFAKSESDELNEILCAQIIVARHGSPTDALLAVADSWNELHAGAAEFSGGHGADGSVQLATVPEGGCTHALSFRCEGDVVISSWATHLQLDLARNAAALLVQLHEGGGREGE